MFGDLLYKIGLDGSAASRTLSGLQSGIGGLHGALLGLGIGAGFTKIIKDGFEFNKTLGDSEAAIAKVLAQFQGLDDVASKAAAAGAMQQLIALEPKAAGTLNTLTDGFLSTLAASQSAGISVKQNIDLVGRFANAMANANIPTEQLGQEMRSIVTANIGADSSLAKVLGITNEMIQQAQQAGNVYEFLRDKIGKMGEAGDTAAVRISSMQSAIQKAEGAFTEGLFKQALDGSVELTDSINENVDAVRSLGSAVADVASKLVEGIGAAANWGRAIGITAGVYADMLNNGSSYAEAMANAEDALTESINERANATQAAAAATASSAAGPGTLATSGAGTPRKKKEESAEDIADETLSKQQKLNELKRQAAEDEMTSAQKITALRERLAAAMEYEATIKSIDVSGDARVALDAEEKRVTLARELAQLLKEEAQAQEQLAKKMADKAAAARKEVESHNQSRNNLLGELAILEAQASGHDKKAKELQRELQIANDTLTIMRDQQTTEAEALRLATRKADAQDKLAKRRDRDGNRDENQGAHIGGTTKSKRGFGGLAEFDALQKGPTLGLAGPGRASSLDAFKAMQRGGENSSVKLLGGGRGQALSERLAQSTAIPKPETGNNKEDSTSSILTQVLGELKRIRTT